MRDMTGMRIEICDIIVDGTHAKWSRVPEKAMFIYVIRQNPGAPRR